MMIRTYSELISIKQYEDRYSYLKLSGVIGQETFGFDRYLNQILYKSSIWRHIRDDIIIRDRGCDLAFDGYEIVGKIYVHHMNPIEPKDLMHADNNFNEDLFNPEYLISVSHNTHMAIHYGDKNLLIGSPVERSKNDTCPWKR